MLPDVLGPAEAAGRVTRAAAEALGMPADMLIGPGANDQPVCALALGITSDDVLVSLGTSGTVSVRHPRSVADPTGAVTGVADAAGRYRPLVCTINATRVTDFAARLLQVDYPTLSELALAAPSDADRPILVPFLEGERTPNRPFASGSLLGLRTATTRESMARAAFEGVLCSLLEGLDRLGALGVPTSGRVVLTGGGAASPAYRRLTADLIGRPVHVSDMEETSASGAAVGPAAVLHGVEVDRVVEAWAPALPEVASPHGAASRWTRSGIGIAGWPAWRLSMGRRRFKLPDETGIFLVLVVVFVTLSTMSSTFGTVNNALVLLLNGAVIGFLALGQRFVLLTGGIDLSTAANMALSGVLGTLFMSWGIPWPARRGDGLDGRDVDRRHQRSPHPQGQAPRVHRHVRHAGCRGVARAGHPQWRVDHRQGQVLRVVRPGQDLRDPPCPWSCC